jgi:hypothetical protein
VLLVHKAQLELLEHKVFKAISVRPEHKVTKAQLAQQERTHLEVASPSPEM